jgi:hypothetical protein
MCLSNYLDRHKWYRSWLGGDWYLVHFHTQTQSLTFWMKRYPHEDLEVLRGKSLTPYIDILEIESCK